MGFVTGHNKSLDASASIPTISVEDMDPFVQAMHSAGNAQSTFFDGDKFVGGFGNTFNYITDYATLRQRSNMVFNDNLYGRGLIRRIITNEINIGLSLEAVPTGEMLGLTDEQVTAWSENVENRFQIWGSNPLICDHKELSTFGALQRECRLEALVGGDVLVVVRISRKNKLPQIQLISGSRVETPLDAIPRKGNIIKHGVEIDSRGRQVAFYVSRSDGRSDRISAFSERTGRRVSWLVYGTDKRVDDVRGQPMLALILQSLKEIDRTRDAVQRKAVINSLIAVYFKKEQNTMGTGAFSAGAVKKTDATVTDANGAPRNLEFSQNIPGMVMQELAPGEEPVIHSTAGSDINFGPFENSILNGIAWANEIPPSILMLLFSSNYSASRGEINELKMYLDKSRSQRADEYDKPIYIEWLLNEVLKGKISAPGLLNAWRDPEQYDIFGAWIQSDWTGAIKPNVDLKKEVAAYQGLIKSGLITSTRATKDFGMGNFDKNIRRIKAENEKKVKAFMPFLKLEKEFPNSKALPGFLASEGIVIDDIADQIQEALEDNAPANS